ncbi:hypothetical protein ACFC34_35880 [Streptomyces sp. NPDC056053]|uniref:hypothetical protein n=1 Tax=Streptomyces sp. NPDC056053 TaxID=3345696 RepID=UPI0035E1A6A7
MELTIVVQNLGLGGLHTGSGDPNHRWPLLAERINSAAGRVDAVLLRRTATDDRIDQLWVSAPLRDTVVDYALLDTPDGASDHHGLVVRLDLDQAATDNDSMWEYR